MGYRYVILGAGRQGTACAYDLAFSEDTGEVILADAHRAYAEKAVERLRSILPRTYRGVLRSCTVSVQDHNGLVKLLKDCSALLSVVPYHLNPLVAQAAISTGVSMCDLGGDTPTVFEMRALHDRAKAAGVAIIPDCGLAPGMSNLLAVYGMGLLDQTDSVEIRCGGLPQTPVEPLGYRLVFNLKGLLNNYFGKAYVLRDGRVTEIESFTEWEEIELPPPLGRCEAFVTAGATSTCPWTFEGKVKSYNYKTVRYPGHYEKMRLLRDLGLLNARPVEVKGVKIAPLDLFERVAGEKIAHPDVPDLVVLRVTCRGRSGSRPTEVNLDLMVFYDPETRFLAMEQTTGFSAAVILQMLARREIKEMGVLPLETAVSAPSFVQELRRRGMDIKETIGPLTGSNPREV
jgi:lysine 6-dehydrogenase